jgi:hypothetical protein
MGELTKKEKKPPSSSTLEKSSLISFLPLFQVETESDIKDCFLLWEKFSPKKNLFDLWEFRYAFYLGYKYRPHFLILKENQKEVGLLPLWYDSQRKKFFWFGSDWQEEVSFYVKDKRYIENLLEIAPSPLFLNAITKEGIEDLISSLPFKKDDPKYVLDLKNFKNHEDFLKTLKKNTRRNLRKDRNRILRQSPKIIFDDFSYFPKLVELSKKRFIAKGEKTDWEDPRRIETFEKVISLSGKSYKARMIIVKIKDEIAGIDLIALYRKTYFCLKCGYDVENFPGIGNFVNLLEIDDAIRLGMEKIDFLQNSYQWKEKYFTPLELFKFEK